MRATFRNLGADTKILFGSLVLIALLSIITVLTAPPSEAPRLSVRSDKVDGAMVLQRWLQRNGYKVQEVLSLSKQLSGVKVLFVLEPIISYSDSEIRLIADWVQKGNTLIVSGAPYAVNNLVQTFDLSLAYPLVETDPIASAAPTLLHPTFDAASVEVAYSIRTERADAVPHLFISNLPVLMSVPEEKGRVWVSGVSVPFTNLGIQNDGNAKIIANLLASIPASATIGFDEAAHGFGDETALDFNSWLFSTPPGWGILLGVAITMVYLALRGRRFGRALPLPDDRLRRESGEYIQAMATLFRRSGERTEMLKHYESQLRRRLAERYAIDTTLGNDELLKMVTYHNPSIDETEFRELLARLRKPNISEAELVRTVSDVDTFMKQLNNDHV
ncbi:MAG: DUF4350 domain-containing protein [Anaerolineaceae bacterium]|nr:DUF4350 domain-containing protein [Anaerolineaceae bacterium]